jgi:hypothetical protein
MYQIMERFNSNESWKRIIYTKNAHNSPKPNYLCIDKKLNIMKKNLLLLFSVLFSLNLLAQWTDDSLTNSVICNAAGDKGVPKISLLSDNGCYISWYGGASNYDINLQRLDFAGNILWQENGIVVSNHPQETWVTDFDMKSDNNDNAVIVFNDIRNGNWDVFVYKISPGGEQLFGENGQAAGDSPVADMTPRVCVTSDNSVIIAWMREGVENISMIMQKFDSQGNKLWEVSGRELSMAGASVKWPYLQPTDDGGFILGYFVETGPFWAPDKLMYAMRYDYDGNAVWDNPVELCGATGITAWEDYKAIPDGNNGMIAFWQDDIDNNTLFNASVQHVLADGTLAFPANGVELATTSSFNHYYDYATGLTSGGEIMVFWAQADGNQNYNGLMGQKISPEGVRLWGDEGLELIPMNSTFRFIQATAFKNDTSFLVYEDSENYLVKAINTDGDEVWTEDTPLSLSPSSKMAPAGTSMAADQVVIAWIDEQNSEKNVKAQNFLINGKLGQVETGIKPINKANKPFKLSGTLLLVNYTGLLQLNIYDGMGRLCEQFLTQGNTEINLQNLANQLYIIVAMNEKGETLQTLKTVTGK